jgi:hypothetical protein
MFPGEHLDPLFIPKLMQDERKSKGSEVFSYYSPLILTR